MTATDLRLAVDDHGEAEIFHSIQGEGASAGALTPSSEAWWSARRLTEDELQNAGSEE